MCRNKKIVLGYGVYWIKYDLDEIEYCKKLRRKIFLGNFISWGNDIGFNIRMLGEILLVVFGGMWYDNKICFVYIKCIFYFDIRYY